ncbi:MAG: cupin domain-containing protein [Candidatus Eremiobacteraeota bacterium]|nr:cupin domain-containing protein [Candidatus Eremiobacteraeota bacterium]
MQVPIERLVPCGPGAEWAVLPGDGQTLVYWVFEAPQCGDLPMHRHPETQSGYVLEGEMVLKYEDGTEQQLRTGDFYSIESGVAHGASVDRRVVLLDIYAPPRPDYEARYRFMTQAKRGSRGGSRVSAVIQ